jgi:hypothetical protein
MKILRVNGAQHSVDVPDDQRWSNELLVCLLQSR